MEIDPETLNEIQAILKRECAVEVTVAFFDDTEGEDALEPVDIACTLEFEPGTAVSEMRQELSAMLDSLKGVMDGMEEPKA